MVKLDSIHDHVIAMLEKGLSKSLTYHNVDHTLDVYVQCMAIAKEEGITDKEALLKLQIAALYHDAGFIYIYQQHEAKGCEIARDQLPGFGLDKSLIEDICEIIMATKVPQMPATFLQKIICDADLDYLGREDFFIISNNLKREWIEYKLIESEQEWDKKQLEFLQSHHNFTESSNKRRKAGKLKYINHLLKEKNERK